MNGLEKIISTINEQSDERKKNILTEADENAEKILSEAELDAKKNYEHRIAEANERANRIIGAAKSTATLIRNKMLLKARVECIYGVLDEAVKNLQALPDNEYFKLMHRLIVSNAEPKNGELILNAADLKRLPQDFINSVNKDLKNGKLTLCHEKANIDSGFILKYGDIEINCSFSSLASSKSDEIKDAVAKVLFD